MPLPPIRAGFSRDLNRLRVPVAGPIRPAARLPNDEYTLARIAREDEGRTGRASDVAGEGYSFSTASMITFSVRICGRIVSLPLPS